MKRKKTDPSIGGQQPAGAEAARAETEGVIDLDPATIPVAAVAMAQAETKRKTRKTRQPRAAKPFINFALVLSSTKPSSNSWTAKLMASD